MWTATRRGPPFLGMYEAVKIVHLEDLANLLFTTLNQKNLTLVAPPHNYYYVQDTTLAFSRLTGRSGSGLRCAGAANQAP